MWGESTPHPLFFLFFRLALHLNTSNVHEVVPVTICTGITYKRYQVTLLQTQFCDPPGVVDIGSCVARILTVHSYQPKLKDR